MARTGDIGVCFITSESASSAGVRRIEAVAGEAAYAHAVQQRARLRAVASRLNTAESDVEARLEQHMEAMAALKQQCYSLMQRQAQQQVRVWADEAVSVGAFRVVIQQVDTDDRQVLSQMGDALKQRCAPAIILLAGVAPGATDEIALLAMVDKKAQGHITAKALLAEMIEHVGGRGGGRPDRAQGGGKDVQALPAALLALHDVVEKACSTSL